MTSKVWMNRAAFFNAAHHGSNIRRRSSGFLLRCLLPLWGSLPLVRNS